MARRPGADEVSSIRSFILFGTEPPPLAVHPSIIVRGLIEWLGASYAGHGSDQLAWPDWSHEIASEDCG